MPSIKNITVIFGTRPEAIKLAPVIIELKKRPELFECRVLVTGQHRQMLDQVLEVFHIVPDEDLNSMQPDQDLAALTALLVDGIGKQLARVKTDMIIVQGDTSTTFVGALVGHYHKIPVAHMEAGLRSFNKHQPFPEETNRTLTSSLADIHFAPTESARQNLFRHGVDPDAIFVTGNTIVDALQYATGNNLTGFDLPDVRPEKKIILITSHRRENFDGPLKNVCHAIIELKKRYSDLEFIFSVHMNPRVRRVVMQTLDNYEGIQLLEPLDYLSFVKLMERAHIILTDSGGIQEEAPSLGKPILVLRNVTERPEGVAAGVARIVGTDVSSICAHVSALVDDPFEYDLMAKSTNPYGDGQAARRIVDVIGEKLISEALEETAENQS